MKKNIFVTHQLIALKCKEENEWLYMKCNIHPLYGIPLYNLVMTNETLTIGSGVELK